MPGSDLVADGDKVIDAKVTTTDAAGNSTTSPTANALQRGHRGTGAGHRPRPDRGGGDNTVNKAEADDKAA